MYNFKKLQVDQGPKWEKVFLEESGHFLCELMVGKNFLNKRLKRISHKGKIDKLKLKPSLWKKRYYKQKWRD